MRTTDYMSERDLQDLRDAGRGHLIDGAGPMLEKADTLRKQEREEGAAALGAFEISLRGEGFVGDTGAVCAGLLGGAEFGLLSFLFGGCNLIEGFSFERIVGCASTEFA
jgi:hypothetical protein